MQLCIENVDQSGGCSYGYSCAYTDSISWASPSQPLPMIRDPRVVFDLQALAFASDLTRVFAFKLGRDASNRVYPESGFKGAFHSASHHQEKEERILDFAKINKYHVSLVPYLLEKLKSTPDGDGG